MNKIELLKNILDYKRDENQLVTKEEGALYSHPLSSSTTKARVMGNVEDH